MGMKYLVFSDIHGSKYYFDYARDLINRESPDKIILLGDLYYHGPRNPLPKGYAPREVCDILNTYADRVIAIKGNCDAEVDEMISSFPFAKNVRLNIAGKTIMCTHGHKYDKDNVPDGVDVIIYGHYHTGFITKDNVIAINAGSVSLPKENTAHSYLLIDDNKIELKNLITGEVIDSIFL